MSATPEKNVAGGAASSAATAPIGVRTRAVVSGHWVIVAVAAAAALATVVFVLLPGWTGPRPPSQAPAAASVPPPVPARIPDAADSVRLRLAAEEARLRYEARLSAARAQRVEAWAAEELANVIDIASAAAASIAAGDLAGGARRYDAAVGRLSDISGRAETAYADALERGEAAIQSGEQGRADEAFRVALAIRPDAEAAQAGLARAERLTEVLERMNAGATHAQAGEWEAARGAYAEAAKLDPAFRPAKQALARVERNVAESRFATLVTRGLSQLDRGDWSDAERTFQAAARLRPGDRSAVDGLARAQEGLERDQLAGIRSEAQRLESGERWTEALAAYRRALAVDPTLDFATRGMERSERMAKLHADLDTLLADPKRLYSPRVREAAREALAATDAVPAPGPRLTQARERLETALRRATTPIAIQLASDDATDVAIHRVGSFGRFQSREIELPPGTYTVVGSRAGYRDVRLELIVDPDAAAPRVFIACREPV